MQARLVKTNHIIGTWDFDEKHYPYIGVMKCLDEYVYFLFIFKKLIISKRLCFFIVYYLKNTLVHAWPQISQLQNKFFTNITVNWVAPDINNWDVEFV